MRGPMVVPPPMAHADVEVVDHEMGIRQNKEAVSSVHRISGEDSSLEGQDGHLSRTKSTQDDAAGMRRMGKEQQLVRQFRLLSITSFVAIATAAWEIGLFVLTPGLVDGGRSGLLWNTIWNFIGFGPIYLSMAEMASMAPIAGAQYHWVSEFAPEGSQRFLSYVTGWTSSIAWQAGNAMGIFLVGSLIQTIILVNDENYSFPNYHGTLLAIFAMCIAFCGVVYGAKALPYWQNAVFAIHIIAYFAYIVPVWVSAPAATHSEVWLTGWENSGGWSSMGLTVLVGQLAGISQQVGIDTAAHMSEEVKDASRAIPKAMITIYLVNFCLIFPAVLTVIYHCPDLEAALGDSTTYPAIYVLRQAMSVPWITVILVVICLLNVASNIVYLAAVTRDLLAFARDKGLPFSKWISTVSETRHIPVNACILSCGIAVLLSMIYIGSITAFYAITSLSTLSLLQCYSLSIGCVLYRRVRHPGSLPTSHFSLGRWGIPVNAMAVTYAIWALFWCAWPQYVLDASTFGESMNYASIIFVSVLIFAMVYFVFKARHEYFGPVTEVEGRKAHFHVR
nr:hypothetical protein B0A51_15996 [Rachicladosporium sp. CCFEE 5018]